MSAFATDYAVPGGTYSTITAGLAGAGSSDRLILASNTSFNESNLIVDSDIDIVGDGTQTIGTSSGQPVFYIQAGASPTFSDLTIDSQLSNRGIRMDAGTGVTLTNVNILNALRALWGWNCRGYGFGRRNHQRLLHGQRGHL